MKTILITGGAGFIGSNLVRFLYKRYTNYKILVLDALTYAGSINNLPEGSMNSDRFEFWYGSVRNAEMVSTLVSRSDIVIHFAAETHVTRSIYDNLLFFDTDVIGTQIVANAVLKYRDHIERFIHISTSEVYGTALHDTMDEQHPLNPMSPYAAAKCGADRLVYSYWATYKLPVVIIRPFNNYGAHQHLEKLIPRFITSCLLGEPLMIHGDGTASRDYLHVEDHCEALDLCIHADIDTLAGEIINLGTGNDISITEIAEYISYHMAKENIEIIRIGDRPGQVFRHACNAKKAKALLGWEPKTDFEKGIKSTIRWYEDHESWWQPQIWMRKIPIVTANNTRELH